MPTLRDALRRILQSVPPVRKLADEEIEELVTHAEEGVERFRAEGKPEPEAISLAIEALGDLEAVARQLRRARRGNPAGRAVLAMTDAGRIRLPGSTASLLNAYGALLFLAAVAWFILPPSAHMWGQIGVRLPWVTKRAWEASCFLRTHWIATVGTLAILGALCVGAGMLRRREALVRRVAFIVGAIAVGVDLAAVIAVSLPFLSLLSGLAP